MTAEENFSKNVATWKITSPQWAELLEKITCSFVSFHDNPDGKHNLTIQSDGIEYFFYPIDNIQETEENWLKKINTSTNHVLFIYGIGLGYHYEALKNWLHADLKRKLVFFEDNLEVVHRFFETDLAAEFLQDKQVRLEFISWPWSHEDEALRDNAMAYCFEHYEIACSIFYERVRSDRFFYLKELLSYLLLTYKKSYAEIFNSPLLFLPNFLQNLKLLPTGYLGSSMKGKFSGIPAIICGAGPSLSKNVNFLKTLSDRALIFGAGTSMNALNSLEVVPHFGVGIDPNEAQFERIIANKAFEIPFFYRNRIYSEALKIVQADRIFISGAGFYTFPQWIEEQLGIETLNLDEGNNVINFSISIAEMLGCNPIVLVGVDLAYTDNQSYASDLKEHALSHQANSFITKSKQEELIIEKDIYGKEVYTLWKWKREGNWIGLFATTHPNVQLINATEGGLGFPYVPNKTLFEVAAEFMKTKYDFASKIHQEIQHSAMPSSVTEDKVFEVISSFKESLERCQKIYLDLVKENQLKEKASLEKIQAYREALDKEPAQKIYLDPVKRMFSSFLGARVKLDKTITEQLESKDQIQNDVEAESCRFVEKYVQQTLKVFPDYQPSIVKKHESVSCTEGSSCFYYASGALKVRKLPDGKQEYFYETGILKTVLPYKDGQLDGTVLMFYPDGSKKREIDFKNGLKSGFERLWSDSGQLLIEAEYKDDKPIHTASSWYKNGQSKLKVHYDEEGREQLIEEWDPFGGKKKAKDLDYFDQLIITTKNLAEAIDLCFLKIEDVLKNLQTDESEFFELKKNLSLLKESNLKIQTTFSKESFKEPIWKSDLFQKQIHHQIGGMIDMLILEVNNIYQAIEQMVKNRHG